MARRWRSSRRSLPAAAQELGVIPNRVIYPGETIDRRRARKAKVTLKRQGRSTTAFAHRARRSSIGKVAKRTLLPGRFVPLASVREA